MDFQLNEEQRIFKKTVHDFADQRLAPLVQEWDEKGTFTWTRRSYHSMQKWGFWESLFLKSTAAPV